MDRQQMLDALAQAGVDVSKITDVVPDEVLAEMLRVMQEMMAQAGTGATDQGANASGDTGGGAGGIASLIPKSLTAKFSEMESTIARLTSVVTNLQGTATATANLITSNHDQARKDAVNLFCEQQLAAGKLTPAEVECDKDGNPLPHTEKATLLRADHTKRCHAFSEGGKTVQKTGLELEMERIKARTPNKFSEKIAAKGGGKSGDLYAKVRERAKHDHAARNGGGGGTKDLHQRLGLQLPASMR